MKAVLLRKEGKGLEAVVSKVPVPEVGPGDILVEMKACGLCGTDLEKMKGEYTASAPVLGHEAVGVVSAVGSEVSAFKAGDRVFPHHHVPCGDCYYCRHGDLAMCADYRRSNLDPGGFSEFFRVPRWNVEKGGVVKMPARMGFELGSLIEPVACCIRAIDRCGVKRRDSVLVAGAGPVGVSHSILLKSIGADVMVSDVTDARLRFVDSLGSGAPLDAKSPAYVDEVRKRTAGRGADIGIVASGSPRAIVQTLKAVRKGGKVCLFGIPVRGSTLDYDLSEVYNSDISLVPSYGATEAETPRAIEALMDDERSFSAMITHRFPLEGFTDAVKTATSGDSMKVLITHGP